MSLKEQQLLLKKWVWLLHVLNQPSSDVLRVAWRCLGGRAWNRSFRSDTDHHFPNDPYPQQIQIMGNAMIHILKQIQITRTSTQNRSRSRSDPSKHLPKRRIVAFGGKFQKLTDHPQALAQWSISACRYRSWGVLWSMFATRYTSQRLGPKQIQIQIRSISVSSPGW